MPDAPSYPSRMIFSSDLRRIREARTLTLEALHEETRIPLSVLEDFEETGLFDNPMFNRVYLRSLARTYALFIGIPTKAMLEALDAALLDNYKGSLAQVYLADASTKPSDVPEDQTLPTLADSSIGEEPTPEAPTVEEPEAEQTALEAPMAEETAPEAPQAEEPTAEEPDVEVPTSEESATPEASDVEETAPEAPVVEAPTAEETASEEVGVVEEIQHLLRAGEIAQNKAPEAPDAEEVDLPDTPSEHPSRGRTRPPLLTTAEATREPQSLGSGGRRRRPVDVKRRAWYTQWVVIVGAVLVFAAAIWAVIVLIDRPEDISGQQAATADIAAADTAAAAIDDVPPQPQITLDDTLYVVLLATEKVERIQIRRDNDLLRAYWIEEGVAKAFPALERIVFENRLDLIRLFVEGFEYPTDIRDEDDRVVITRAGLQAFADSLTTSSVQLPAPPDTIPLWPVSGQ